MEKKIRFAIIGCGRIAPKHAAALEELEDAELVVVCDTVEEKAKAFAHKYNCTYVLDYHEILKRENIDVINICTHHGLHAQITIDAANAGKHVVTEKPMAMSIKEADAMIEACDKNNVKLFVVKQNRYNPPIVKLREAINEKRFGKIFLGNVTVRWSRPQEYYDQDPWRGTKKYDGGVLMNQASHHIDLLQWMLGDVESVVAKKDTMLRKIESEDTAVAILKFKNGAMGVIEATTCIYSKNLEGSLSIFGENGSVKVGGFAVNKMETWQFKDFRNDDAIIAEHASTPTDVYGFGHIAFMRDVLESLKNNTNPPIDGREARKSLELINAIYHSAETGKEVFLPLKHE